MDKYDVNTRSAIMMSRSSDEVEHRVSTALQVMMEMAKPYWTIVQRYVDDYETKIQDSIDMYHSLFKKGFEQTFQDEGLLFQIEFEKRELGYRFLLTVEDEKTGHSNSNAFYILDYPLSSRPVVLSTKEVIRWQLHAFYVRGEVSKLTLYRVEDRTWIEIDGFTEVTPEYKAKYQELHDAFKRNNLILNPLTTDKNLTTIEIMDYFLKHTK